MKNEALKKFFQEYKEYLVDTDHTSYCADQYCTYLRKACAMLDLGEGFLEAIVAISDSNVQAALCEYLMSKLSNKFKNSTDKAQKKQISNYKSAVSMLSEFVSESGTPKSSSVTVSFLPAVTLPFESVYSQKELFNIFKSRLVTQDRYYYGDEKCFPSRIINRIATKHKRKLYNNLILDTRFLYEADGDKFFLLRDIDGLTIKTDGFVKIEVKGKEYDVYTEVWKDLKFVGYELLRVNSVKYISLDHMVSVHSELIPFIETHSELEKFSKHVMDHKQIAPDMTVADFSSNYFNSHYGELSVDEEILLDQISEFVDKLELLILHKSYNSGKNDSV